MHECCVHALVAALLVGAQRECCGCKHGPYTGASEFGMCCTCVFVCAFVCARSVDMSRFELACQLWISCWDCVGSL